ncbi:MAG: TetR/AcrR family transcriptional regulator [Polyangiaceae bacterium]
MATRRSRTKARKNPLQERSRAMVEAILEAAARVFVKEGYAASTNRIALAAGVSVGSLYQYFPSKDAIAVELLRRYRESLVELVGSALAEVETKPFEVVVRRLLADLLRAERIDPGLHRVLIEQVLRTPARREVIGFEERFEELLASALRKMGKRVRVKDYEVAAFLLVRVVVTVVQSAVVDRPRLNTPVLVDELTRLVSAYVETGAA